MVSTQSCQIKMAGMLKLVKGFQYATSKLKTIVYYFIIIIIISLKSGRLSNIPSAVAVWLLGTG